MILNWQTSDNCQYYFHAKISAHTVLCKLLCNNGKFKRYLKYLDFVLYVKHRNFSEHW